MTPPLEGNHIVRCFCRRWPHPIRNGAGGRPAIHRRISLSREPMKTPATVGTGSEGMILTIRCASSGPAQDATAGILIRMHKKVTLSSSFVHFVRQNCPVTEIGQGSRDHRSYWNLGLYSSGAIASDCGIFIGCVMPSDVCNDIKNFTLDIFSQVDHIRVSECVPMFLFS